MAGVGLLIGALLGHPATQFKAPSPTVEAELHAVETRSKRTRAGGLVVVEL